MSDLYHRASFTVERGVERAVLSVTARSQYATPATEATDVAALAGTLRRLRNEAESIHEILMRIRMELTTIPWETRTSRSLVQRPLSQPRTGFTRIAEVTVCWPEEPSGSNILYITIR